MGVDNRRGIHELRFEVEANLVGEQDRNDELAAIGALAAGGEEAPEPEVSAVGRGAAIREIGSHLDRGNALRKDEAGDPGNGVGPRGKEGR